MAKKQNRSKQAKQQGGYAAPASDLPMAEEAVKEDDELAEKRDAEEKSTSPGSPSSSANVEIAGNEPATDAEAAEEQKKQIALFQEQLDVALAEQEEIKSAAAAASKAELMKSGTIQFEVECKATAPGEGVFIVGSVPELGEWNPAKALQLTTSKEHFPKWSNAEAVSLAAGTNLQYKFVKQLENRKGNTHWEEGFGDRKVEIAGGSATTVKTSWGNAKEEVQTVALAGAEESQVTAAASQNPAVADQASALQVGMMKRNFSMSLLCAEAPDTEKGKSFLCAETPDTQTADASEPMRPLGMSAMKQIGSLCGLSALAPVEDRTEMRNAVSRERPQYESKNLDVPVVIISSEIAPFSKTGGLGLVASSYAYEFAARGHRTMAISPMYDQVKDTNYVGSAKVWLFGNFVEVKYFHQYKDYGKSGCDYIFVQHECFPRPGNIYCDVNSGHEWGDNLFRFALLSLAALEAPLVLNLGGSPYGDKVTFLANDWQTGLVPVYMNQNYRRNGVYRDARVIYVIHNLGYQGKYCARAYPPGQKLGLDHQSSDDLFFDKQLNLTKGALKCADRLLTVSPNYAKEIMTHEGGFKLQDFVREKENQGKSGGILNGIDDVWDPRTDKHIPINFGVPDYESGKRENKRLLQQKLGLHVDENFILVGFVGRLTGQKGIDILGQCVHWMMRDEGNGVTGRCQLIMMGNGEKGHSEMLRACERDHPGRVCGYVGFDPTVEHQMIAGCDLLLMPSRYEPCGLPQMYSQQYGTLPLVTATGGLQDSVKSIDDHGIQGATGFKFWPLTDSRLKQELYRAMEIFHKQPHDFKQMQRNAMASDFYWPQAMDEYERVIDRTLPERH